MSEQKDGVVVPVALTDEQILGLLAKAADELDATRVHEMRNGKWHATTIFDGDPAALRFARMVLAASPSHPQEKDAERLIEAAKQADWQQVVQNGGPPCFHIGDDGRFCLRAQRWDGHGSMHPFTTLAAAIDRAIKETGKAP